MRKVKDIPEYNILCLKFDQQALHFFCLFVCFWGGGDIFPIFTVLFLKIAYLCALFVLLSLVTECSLIVLWLLSQSTSPTNSSWIRSSALRKTKFRAAFHLVASWASYSRNKSFIAPSNSFSTFHPDEAIEPVCMWVAEPSYYMS